MTAHWCLHNLIYIWCCKCGLAERPTENKRKGILSRELESHDAQSFYLQWVCLFFLSAPLLFVSEYSLPRGHFPFFWKPFQNAHYVSLVPLYPFKIFLVRFSGLLLIHHFIPLSSPPTSSLLATRSPILSPSAVTCTHGECCKMLGKDHFIR